MAGYDPKDSKRRRIEKACYFHKSMLKKGQPYLEALRIASSYYHVPEKAVAAALDHEGEDDDVYFMLGGAVPISASELFDPGDFC